MNCFMDFIKYNPYLIYLDLQSTGLHEPAIRYIAKMLTRSQSLRSVHLCNNPGLSKNMVEWFRKRIRAADYIEPIHIKPFKKSKEEESKPTGMQGAFLKLLGLDKGETENQKWKKIRQGLKLRTIVSSQRMNVLNQSQLIRPALFDDKEPFDTEGSAIITG